MKSHFGIRVPLWICCIFSEHLLLRTPLDGCFCSVSYLLIKAPEVLTKTPNILRLERSAFPKNSENVFYIYIFIPFKKIFPGKVYLFRNSYWKFLNLRKCPNLHNYCYKRVWSFTHTFTSNNSNYGIVSKMNECRLLIWEKLVICVTFYWAEISRNQLWVCYSNYNCPYCQHVIKIQLVYSISCFVRHIRDSKDLCLLQQCYFIIYIHVSVRINYSMSSSSNYRNHQFRSSRKRKRKRNINKKLHTPTKSCLKECMKGSWYVQDGLPHENGDRRFCPYTGEYGSVKTRIPAYFKQWRSSENVTSSASCSKRKLIDWQTKNDEDRWR